MHWQATSRCVGRWYATIFVVLLVVHLISWALEAMGYPSQLGIHARVNFDTEASLPAMFAALSLFTCGLLLGLIAAQIAARNRPYIWRWRLLAAVFVFLAIDEAVSIHELIGDVLERFVDEGGIFSFFWIVPYGILASLGATIYWPWVRSLLPSIRKRFVLAAVLYFLGAIGMEMVGAWLFDNKLAGTNWYTLAITVEESLEFAGVGVFLCALIDQLRELRASATIDFTNGDPSA